MLESLIYLHCKMQSRIRKAGVRQGLGKDRLGLSSMTNPTRVTIWSIICSVKIWGAIHMREISQCFESLLNTCSSTKFAWWRETKCDLICGIAKGLSSLLGVFCHWHMGVTQRTTPVPLPVHEQGKCPGSWPRAVPALYLCFPMPASYSKSAEVASKHTNERESKIRLRNNTNHSVVSNHFGPERTCFLCS